MNENITQLKPEAALEKMLQSPDISAPMFQHIFSQTSSGVTITDYDGNIIDVNPAFTKITGYSREEAIGKTPRVLRSDYQNKYFYENLWHQIKNEGYFQSIIWNRRKSGEVYPETITIKKVSAKDNKTNYFIAVFSEVTITSDDKQTTININAYDPLTKIPGRFLLLEQLNKLIQSVDRVDYENNLSNIFADKQIAVFFIDVDKFKAVNDTYGHLVGDQLLKELVSRLKTITREMDLLSRYGGDEFVLVSLIGQDKQHAIIAAERMLDTLEKPVKIEEHYLYINISIGISIYPGDANYAKELIEKADQAMYQAKKITKGKRYFIYQNIKEQQS